MCVKACKSTCWFSPRICSRTLMGCSRDGTLLPSMCMLTCAPLMTSSHSQGLVWEPTLRQSVSLFGEIFLVFLVGWIASISAGLAVGRVSRGHMYRAGGVAAFLLVFGGIRMQSGRGMWLKDISEWPVFYAYSSKPLARSSEALLERR